MKLTPKLTLVFILFATALLSVVGVLAYQSGRDSLRLATISELSATAIEKQSALNQWVEDKRKGIILLAVDPSTIESVTDLVAAVPGSPEALVAHKRFIAEIQPRVSEGVFISVILMDPRSGEVIAATNPEEVGKFQEDREFFIRGRVAPFVQNVYYFITLQGPAMTASAPMMAKDGRLMAVIAGHINLEEMNDIVQRRSGLHETDDAFLVNTSNLFITQPSLVEDPAVLQIGVHTEAVNRCLSRTSGTIDALDYRGVPSIVTYRWMPEHELCLIVQLDQSEAYNPARAFGKTMFIISGLGLVVAIALAVVLSRTITQPILALQTGAACFGSGQLDTKLPETSRDELGVLAREFNMMAATLAEKERLLRANAAELNDRVKERTAELARSNAELQQFAYVASHDLQEPLRMVASYTKLLEKRYKGRLDEDADEFINYVVDGATRMQQLINSLLDFSRIGTRTREFVATSCEKVLDEAMTNLAIAIKDSGAVITHDPLPTLMADESQLIQLFQNLIGNAIRFRSEQLPEIHISAERRHNDWLFSVRDNGIGMESQYFERIFIIFQRLHTRAEYSGTGIGLAVCKKIVERLGGRIWVESKPGQGSTFFFNLPVFEHKPQ